MTKWEKLNSDFLNQYDRLLCENTGYRFIFHISNKDVLDFLIDWFNLFKNKYMRVLVNWSKNPFTDKEYAIISCSSYDLESYNDIKSVICSMGI